VSVAPEPTLAPSPLAAKLHGHGDKGERMKSGTAFAEKRRHPLQTSAPAIAIRTENVK